MPTMHTATTIRINTVFIDTLSLRFGGCGPRAERENSVTGAGAQSAATAQLAAGSRLADETPSLSETPVKCNEGEGIIGLR